MPRCGINLGQKNVQECNFFRIMVDFHWQMLNCNDSFPYDEFHLLFERACPKIQKSIVPE